jgi:hypothetical protein
LDLERVGREVGYPKTIRLDNGPEFISRDLDLWAFMHSVTLDFSRPGKPNDNDFIESLNGKFRAECPNANWFLSLDEAREHARLGVETTMRCAHTARSATKCLRRFIGGPAIPASPPPDEAGIFQRQVVQGRGQVQGKADVGCGPLGWLVEVVGFVERRAGRGPGG